MWGGRETWLYRSLFLVLAGILIRQYHNNQPGSQDTHLLLRFVVTCLVVWRLRRHVTLFFWFSTILWLVGLCVEDFEMAVDKFRIEFGWLFQLMVQFNYIKVLATMPLITLSTLKWIIMVDNRSIEIGNRCIWRFMSFINYINWC